MPPSGSTSRTTIRRFARPLIALTATLFTLTVVEVALAKLRPLQDPFAGIKAGLHPPRYVPRSGEPNVSVQFNAEKDLSGMNGTSRFSTNELGFRGPPLAIPKETREYRVFLVGGSTTECMFVDDSQSPERILQTLLTKLLPGRPVSVYNAGHHGDCSYDHVAIVAHRIALLEPNLIVVFAGANDQRAAIQNRDYLHRASAKGERPSLLTLLKFAATEFQIPRLLHAVFHRLVDRRERLERITYTTNFRRNVSLKEGLTLSNLAPRVDVAPYGRNLATLAGITKAQGAQMLFVTQASTWNSQIDPDAARWHWMNVDYSEGKYYREDLMDRTLEMHNEEMRRVAGAQGVPVLDVAHLIPKSLEYFYDDMHFNPKGAATYASLVARSLAEQGLLPAIPAKD
jgi:lysophospholipase L1-like esterase